MTKDKSTENGDKPAKKTVKQVIKEELRFFAGLAAFLFLFFNFVFGHYKIPSESMQPTLEVGDHLFVNKFSYGFSKHSLIMGLHNLSFLGDGRVLGTEPKRGDVVVFRSPNKDTILGKHLVMIKRLVGLPGDKVDYRRGRLYVNDQLIERALVENRVYRDHRDKREVAVALYTEQLPDEKRDHSIYERSDRGLSDNVGPFLVPDGKYFFIGDNRDNSGDSRASNGPGLVPYENIIGKAQMMVFSLKRCKKEEGLHCPGFRAFKKL